MNELEKARGKMVQIVKELVGTLGPTRMEEETELCELSSDVQTHTHTDTHTHAHMCILVLSVLVRVLLL